MLSHLQGYTLAVLCEGPNHGYPIIKRIQEMSEGDRGFSIHMSQVYGILKRFTEEGLVTKQGDKYTLTGAGMTVLSDSLNDSEYYVTTCRAPLQKMFNEIVRYS